MHKVEEIAGSMELHHKINTLKKSDENQVNKINHVFFTAMDLVLK